MDLVNVSDIEKIGTVEILPVRRHARRYYLPLDKDLVDAFGLKVGDRLKVKIEGRFKAPGGDNPGE